MKWRLFGVLMTAAMLLSIAAISFYTPENPSRRVHQHLTSRGPGEGCGCDGSELCTHLPLVIIDTGGVEIPGAPVKERDDGETTYTTTAQGEAMLPAHIAVTDDESRNHHPSDDPDMETDALIRIRGNSSRFFDKKSYLLRFTKSDGSYADRETMGMEAHYEWALYGPYLDKTLLRNYLWYNLSGKIMDWAPNVRYCEVILNGEYQGLYMMVETITSGDGSRVNVSEPVSDINTGYVVRVDRGSSTEMKNINNFTYYTYRINHLGSIMLNIVYPRSGTLTQELADSIEQELSDFEKALYSYDYNTEPYDYTAWIDVDNFVDYFLINEFGTNYDAGELSTYLYKDIRGKYKMAVWDFNSACDNYSSTTIAPQHFELQHSVWFYMLTKDEEFVERIIDRYRELRETYLNDDYLEQYIDAVVEYLGPAIDRNFEVWGYTFEGYRPLTPDSRNPDTYEEAVEQLKEFCWARGAWMDEYIETLRQFSHLSKNKKFNH